MKYMLAAAGLLALIVGAGSSPAATAKPANYDAFGIALLQRLASTQPATNVFISPVSIGVALAMAADGAAGSTRSGMVTTLGLRAADVSGANAALIAELRANDDAKIGLANAIWLRKTLPPRPAYVRLLRNSYGAEAQAVEFGNPQAAATINAWVKAHTLGLIDHLIDRTRLKDFAYLTNALAFQATWSTPFKARGTSPHSFTNSDGERVTVAMMTQVANLSVAHAHGYDVVRLPYGSGGFAAYVLLPKTNSTAALLQNITAAAFNKDVEALKEERVALSLPRFTIAYDVSLIPALGAMGMSTAFSPAADFSKMHAPPPELLISGVQHAAYLKVDEAGTTAAAATSVEITMKVNMVLPPARSIVVDHPFLFALRDEISGTLLFVGAIRNLENSDTTKGR